MRISKYLFDSTFISVLVCLASLAIFINRSHGRTSHYIRFIVIVFVASTLDFRISRKIVIATDVKKRESRQLVRSNDRFSRCSSRGMVNPLIRRPYRKR